MRVLVLAIMVVISKMLRWTRPWELLWCPLPSCRS